MLLGIVHEGLLALQVSQLRLQLLGVAAAAYYNNANNQLVIENTIFSIKGYGSCGGVFFVESLLVPVPGGLVAGAPGELLSAKHSGESNANSRAKPIKQQVGPSRHGPAARMCRHLEILPCRP